jgi:hypothetical protein
MRNYSRGALPLLLAFAACGGQSLETPEGLPIREYSAGADFTLTLLMESCSDTCSTYEPAECSTEIEGMEILVEVSVPYSEKEGTNSSTLEGCSLACGPSIFAHCPVSSLQAGTYQVVAGSFRAPITIR